MTQTSQQLRTAKENHAPRFPSSGTILLKFGAALVFACGLALAPIPTFAQHGGGGGGGAHGGGGGGGSHGSSGGFGGGGGSAASSNNGGAHASGGSAGSSSPRGGNSSGGHGWNPFHSGNSSSATAAKGSTGVPAGNIKTEASAVPQHFAAGNNSWQEPPPAGMSAAGRVNYYGPANVNGSRPFVPIATTTRAPITSGTGAHSGAMVAAAQHPFQPVRPGYPYYPYYPYFGYSPYYGAFGFGFGGYGPCNPFWGCFGYGFGYGAGYGYGFGGGAGYFGATSGGYNSGWTDAGAEGSASVTSPDNTDSYLLAAPGTGGTEAVTGSSNGTQELRTDSAPQQAYVLLYLKDGSSFAVSDYWLADGKLHYVTSYGGDNSVDESRVDLQRTVNENAARGVDFTLKPQPAGTGNAATSAVTPTPAPAQNSDPEKPQP
jgi:hypothetical protein